MQVNSFAQACKLLKVDPKSVDVFKALPKEYRRYMTALYKLTIITQAMNEDKKANWNNSGEYKYSPWVMIAASEDKPSGFGFSCSSYAGWSANTHCGSRLTFRKKEDCLFALKKFESLYLDIFLYTK